MKLLIFAGQTLTAAQVHRILPHAEVRPPIERGDAHRALAEGANVLGVVDGAFLDDAAVTTTELVDAMRVGVRVFGSSGVGAIRAAELDHLGMTGCGLIYERIKSGPYFRDDALGLVGVSLIELDLTLARLVLQKKVPAALAREILAHGAALHFSKRTFEQLLGTFRAGDSKAAKACALIEKHLVRQKTLDGQALLITVRDALATTARANLLLRG